MFTTVNPPMSRRQRGVLIGSVAVHGLILAWMLHRPEPQLLNPISIAFGHNGKVATQLYWNSKATDDSDKSSSDMATERYRRQRLARKTIVLKQPIQLAKLPPLPPPVTTPDTDKLSQTAMLSKQGQGAQAGLAYGTLKVGMPYGDEVRPALPITTKDPVVYPWELPDSEGNVVVEITIDERGEIISKTVLQSMGPKLDEKFLVALQDWHFHPATHNGVPIASKQDAVYTYRARG